MAAAMHGRDGRSRLLSRTSSTNSLVEELLGIAAMSSSPTSRSRREGAASPGMLDMGRMLRGMLHEDAEAGSCDLRPRRPSQVQPLHRPVPLAGLCEWQRQDPLEVPLSPLQFSSVDDWLLQQFSPRASSASDVAASPLRRASEAPAPPEPLSPTYASEAMLSWISEAGPSPSRRRAGDEESLATSWAGGNFIEDSALESVLRVIEQGSAPTDKPAKHLSDEEIRALPKVCFQASEEMHCSICLDSFMQGQLLTATPCQHRFHVACLAAWMQRASYCPLCRRECGASESTLSTCEEGSSEDHSLHSGSLSVRSHSSSSSSVSIFST